MFITLYQATENLELVTRDLKQINSVKDMANTILRLQKESDKAKHECDQLERNLSGSGSSKNCGRCSNRAWAYNQRYVGIILLIYLKT